MSLKIAVIYGSVRKNRQGIKGAKFVCKKLDERGHSVKLIDPKKFPLPLLDKMYKEYKKGRAPENMEKLAKIFREADAYVVVTAEYNHGVPPALKNIIDHFMEEYFWKPCGIASYSAGSFGGVRAAMQWRAILPEIGMITIPSLFPMPKVQDSFDEEGNPKDKSYNEKIKKFLEELEWYANILKEARANGTPY